MLALYVIDAEIRESSRSASHDVAHTRLTWWRAETDRLVNGNPQHPATRLLCDHAQANGRCSAKLHEVLAAADMDLARMTFTNQQELRAYCSRSGGAIHELVAAQLAAPDALDESARAAANKLGVGIRLAEMLRDLRQDAYDGNVYLPLDLLDKHERNLNTCVRVKWTRSSKKRCETVREQSPSRNWICRLRGTQTNICARPLCWPPCIESCSTRSPPGTTMSRLNASSSARCRNHGRLGVRLDGREMVLRLRGVGGLRRRGCPYVVPGPRTRRAMLSHVALLVRPCSAAEKKVHLFHAPGPT